jgi:hypothetical protein
MKNLFNRFAQKACSQEGWAFVLGNKMLQRNLFILKSQFVISKQIIFAIKVMNCDLIS